MEPSIPHLAEILVGVGVVLGGIWWSRHRFRLPEIKMWDAAVSRSFLEEHRYMEEFYERRLDKLTRLVARLPPDHKATLAEAAGESAKRLADYRDAIEENEGREVILPGPQWAIASREAALQELLESLALRVNKSSHDHSSHEEIEAGVRGVRAALARVPLLREYFQWKRMLVHLAERSQHVPVRQMVSFRLAERGSDLHVQANCFYKLIPDSESRPRVVRRARRRIHKMLVRFARSVREAQVEGGEKTLILHGTSPRHDPLAQLIRRRGGGDEIPLSDDALARMDELWKHFDEVAAPALGHFDGYLNFVVFNREIPGGSHHELEGVLKKRVRIRVLDKITDEWENVEFEVHFGRFLVFKADWLARARELEIGITVRQKETAKWFALRTVKHRAVSIHPKAESTKTAEGNKHVSS